MLPAKTMLKLGKKRKRIADVWPFHLFWDRYRHLTYTSINQVTVKMQKTLCLYPSTCPQKSKKLHDVPYHLHRMACG